MVNLYRMRQLMNRKTVSVLWQIEQEQAKATKVTTVITGMPRGGGQHDQVSSGAIKLAELKEVYSELISELETMRNELAPLIDTLENIELRAAMRLRYLKGYKPEQIADAICLADRTIYRYLVKAENELCRNFPEKVIHGQLPSSCQ